MPITPCIYNLTKHNVVQVGGGVSLKYDCLLNRVILRTLAGRHIVGVLKHSSTLFTNEIYRVLFFNCSAQISVLKRSFVHQEYHGRESLIG